MRVESRIKTNPLFLMDADFEYSKTRQGYVLAKSNGSEEATAIAYEFLDRIPDDYLLFPQGFIYEDRWFRRCDGTWIRLEDDATFLLVKTMVWIASHGGYVASKKSFIELISPAFGMDVDKASIAIAQSVACGALGEYTPTELGYKIPELREVVYDRASLNLYCGNLALWEQEERRGEINHLSVAHLYRKIYSEKTGEETVISHLEQRCKERKAVGYPNLIFEEECFRLACELVCGLYIFVDEPPYFFTRCLEVR
ncbi:MAG: hypothetical protein RMH75_07060 [Archaeoglobaceae archaeon]|nr:hypothetical protein [Archaeoglobaceae archaeon]MDW7990399.1 hypothetical protein [Archaeoglobaceae archaeon]